MKQNGGKPVPMDFVYVKMYLLTRQQLYKLLKHKGVADQKIVHKVIIKDDFLEQ